MLASARWVGAAALTRDESRGLHMREDRPLVDPAQARRLLTGGLEQVWTRFDHAISQTQLKEVAA
ncbi:hypothetical protein [Sphingobium sp. YG1]|nr:hypothetical protein [Sphingobium sp. YG1]BBD00042.1 hypothetical protein YGS_C1P1297 [Sphingobium sp. YG1]